MKAIPFYGIYITEYDGDGNRRNLPRDLDEYAHGEQNIHYLFRDQKDGGSIIFVGVPLQTVIRTESFDIDPEKLKPNDQEKEKAHELVEEIPSDLEAVMSQLDVHLLWDYDDSFRWGH